ncbi:MAG: hybrid sensor histidine kinase/response regulator [Aquificaceae bacterium]|nr:MAG: hybrid sensor histidine kinase/response regulator [Aquificaceae bacterium]
MVDRCLRRQLKKANLTETEIPANKAQWQAFLETINSAYASNKNARYLLEKALDESTKEMTQLNKDLKEEAEEKLKAVRESEKKSRFMENMSHELRTPIHGILGSLEIVKDDTNLDPKQKTFINTALTSGENLLDIVNNILDFSKINANKLFLEKMPFNIRELFADVNNIVATMSDDKGLKLITNIDKEVPARVKGDPSKVRQIMMNLANNAVKFTSSGSIVCEVKLLELNDKNTILRIEITDTGIGIPEPQMDEIFNAFAQVDASTTREYEGIGLGLTISKELAHLMGGTINLESMQGQGSHFWVDIPFESVDFYQEEVQAESSDLSALKVLIVEQDKANLSLFDHYFSQWGVEYLMVDNGRDAINELYKSRADLALFDIALVDYFMPGMDSLDLSEILNSHPDFQRIPKVVLSGYALAEEERRIANIDICLTKPIRENMLKDVLLECLQMKNRHIQKDLEDFAYARAIGFDEVNNSVKHDYSVENMTDILLAEDNPVNALIATTIMEKLGLTVKHVTDGQKAVDEIKANRYKLILMDMHMPIMDGYNATKNIRQWEEESEREAIPIIALTANALAGDRDKCLAAGMDDYLPKPVKKEVLKEVVTKWTEASMMVL